MAKKKVNPEAVDESAQEVIAQEHAPKRSKKRLNKTAESRPGNEAQKKERSELEEYVIGSEADKITYEISPRFGMESVKEQGKSIKVEVTQNLPIGFFVDLMRQLPAVYFRDTGYDPFFGRNIIEMVLFEAYTGLSFSDDVDMYNKFKALYRYSPAGVEGDVIKILPKEAFRFLDACDEKISQLCKMYFTPAEVEKLFEACTGFVERAEDAIGKLEAYLDAFAKNGTMGDVPMKDIVKALKGVSNVREREIATAVLDFQQAKAKKAAKEKEADKKTTKE